MTGTCFSRAPFAEVNCLLRPVSLQANPGGNCFSNLSPISAVHAKGTGSVNKGQQYSVKFVTCRRAGLNGEGRCTRPV